MGRSLTAEQFTAYARRQIHTAWDILDRHRAGLFGLCDCGRAQPCSVAVTCHAAIARYTAKLALVEATQPLPPLAFTAGRASRRGVALPQIDS
ncbi:hypothetical protein Cs7R123_11260 [Catellatospora sp. TT07R-123]|nr:hypothetical protein Cs7R123_11260 [Catellatospora sp. TT07R-123]